jgi:hypothetical protein
LPGSFAQAFQGPSRAHRTNEKVVCFAKHTTTSRDNPIP